MDHYIHIKRIRRQVGQEEYMHPSDQHVLKALHAAGYDFPDVEDITEEDRTRWVATRTLYRVYRTYVEQAVPVPGVKVYLLTRAEFGASLRWLWPHLERQWYRRWVAPYVRECGFWGVRGPDCLTIVRRVGRPKGTWKVNRGSDYEAPPSQ